MSKLCLLFNYPSLYREVIYTKIDQEYDCDWYFMKQESIVKTFDVNKLKSSAYLDTYKIGPFFWNKGLISLLWKDYNIYFISGETRNITLFPFIILKRIFFRKKKIYFWTHGFYGKESKLELALWKRPLFKLPDGLFTYGDYAKKIMVEDGFNPDNIYPIHNSLAYDEQLSLRNQLVSSSIYTSHFGNTNPVLIFIGRLTEVKRLDMILDAVSNLKKNNEHYNVVFIGDGVKRQNLEKQAYTLGISDNVWFYGACYNEKDNAELIYNADLCVAPGNIGLTSIHALMFGCPAVSHNNFCWQMPEFEAIKDGLTGCFYEYGSVDSLAQTISKWFRNNKKNRDDVRKACYDEIDIYWNPNYQMKVIKDNLNL